MILWNVLRHSDHRAKVAHAGAIEPLVALLRSSRAKERETGARLIWLLSLDKVGRSAAVRADAPVFLRELLEAKTAGEREGAAGALRTLEVLGAREREPQMTVVMAFGLGLEILGLGRILEGA